MSPVNRREFLQASAASFFLKDLAAGMLPAKPAKVQEKPGRVVVQGADYRWEWSRQDDEFRLYDKFGMIIAHGKHQPAVRIQPTGQAGKWHSTAGKPVGHETEKNKVTIRYGGVNGDGKLAVTWRFDDDGFWLEPVVYESPAKEDVVSFHLFAEGMGSRVRPTLGSNYLVDPGASESGELSPILLADEQPLRKLELTNWLGHGSFPGPGWFQQWGLPAHYICGFHRSPYDYQKTPDIDFKGAAADELLGAFCCGLAELTNGQLFVDTAGGRYSLLTIYRGDLWGHLRGPGRLSLGSTYYWAVGPNFYEAIRRYYRGLLKAGVIKKKVNSAHKTAMALAPSFDTWGAQVARDPSPELFDRIPDRFDEAGLNAIFNGLKNSGMKADMFVIDGYWEGKYGSLKHSEERFPHFDETLERIRKDGYRLGLWAAFLRCQDPSSLGLTPANMLRRPDGTPFSHRSNPAEPGNLIYLFDFTQPEVQKVMRNLAKEFVRRYKPNFVKFDFGYEIPRLSVAAPKDMHYAGERMLYQGIQVIGDAMREVNPDIVILYYSLSPLFIDYFDVHSPDDMALASADYDLEANRRFFFSSLLGEIGMPTWGSGGYDWLTSLEIWFDSAVLGTLGSLGSFSGPDPKALATPERVAKFNGLTHVLRPSIFFSIIPLDAYYYGATRGAHASSWARVENDQVVAVALRKYMLTGGEGSGKFRDLVLTNTSVVVASKTEAGISTASQLAVVPYGDGEVTFKREGSASGHAEAITHYFGGGKTVEPLEVQNGRLRLRLRTASPEGTLVEWIEVNFAAS